MVIRVKPEKKEEKERVRLALFRAALELAAQHGFASLSLREVAREALIAPTSFYRHFEDMQELGLALIEEEAEPLLLQIAARCKAMVLETDDLPRAIVESWFACIEKNSILLRFVLAERVGGNERFRTLLGVKIDHLTKQCARLCEAADTACRGEVAVAVEAMLTLSLEAVFGALDTSSDVRSKHLRRAVEQARLVSDGARAKARGDAGPGLANDR